MATPVHTPSTWRFGVFEVDARNAELRRAGIPIRLREQSSRILVLLLERAGELVTREDLRKALWPADTFVDFDHSLNAAVMRLREALGDTADKPLYIETIPKRGYRFIAPLVAPQAIAETPTPRTADAPAKGRRWLGVPLVLAALVAGSLWFIRRPLPPLRVSRVTQLTNDVRWMRKIPVGTDGSRVYFDLEGFDFRHTFAQVPVGGGELSITSLELMGGNYLLTGDISPDGSNALLWSDRTESTASAWIVGTSGFPVRYLADVASATWWPDGQHVLYLDATGELRLVSLSGGDVRLLARIPPGARHLSVSPDGQRIRFDDHWKLWEVRSDGTNLHELVPRMRGSAQRCCGRWSADGAFYTFLSAKTLATTPVL